MTPLTPEQEREARVMDGTSLAHVRLRAALATIDELRGPGTISARFDFLLTELEKRFPENRAVFSSKPPELLYLNAIDNLQQSLWQRTADGVEYEAAWQTEQKQSAQWKEIADYRRCVARSLRAQLAEANEDAKQYKHISIQQANELIDIRKQLTEILK